MDDGLAVPRRAGMDERPYSEVRTAIGPHPDASFALRLRERPSGHADDALPSDEFPGRNR